MVFPMPNNCRILSNKLFYFFASAEFPSKHILFTCSSPAIDAKGPASKKFPQFSSKSLFLGGKGTYFTYSIIFSQKLNQNTIFNCGINIILKASELSETRSSSTGSTSPPVVLRRQNNVKERNKAFFYISI
jgi:hypothetical protein